jgi:hypothetical protein
MKRVCPHCGAREHAIEKRDVSLCLWCGLPYWSAVTSRAFARMWS